MHTTYSEWFTEYRDAFRENDEATCLKLEADCHEFAERLEHEKKDPDWYYTSAELIEMGRLSGGKVGERY